MVLLSLALSLSISLHLPSPFSLSFPSSRTSLIPAEGAAARRLSNLIECFAATDLVDQASETAMDNQ
ncbi:hypothetical protein IEQ34_013619 [Dendrobium chrysotoxum]|uniref:Secreted protein n=1 Tax=Dendrobium chrysotoxum TaxID=161865 RepID=A0AAV7GRD6_DENCH|nr:hypothetical protein IEQ34_013619 [Dendrobium chrysotoxum]